VIGCSCHQNPGWRGTGVKFTSRCENRYVQCDWLTALNGKRLQRVRGQDLQAHVRASSRCRVSRRASLLQRPFEPMGRGFQASGPPRRKTAEMRRRLPRAEERASAGRVAHGRLTLGDGHRPSRRRWPAAVVVCREQKVGHCWASCSWAIDLGEQRMQGRRRLPRAENWSVLGERLTWASIEDRGDQGATGKRSRQRGNLVSSHWT
jgi:hypothetical protein